jgi:hypothetical protein
VQELGLGDFKHVAFANEDPGFCKHNCITQIQLCKELAPRKWPGLFDNKLCLSGDIFDYTIQILQGTMALFSDDACLIKFHCT